MWDIVDGKLYYNDNLVGEINILQKVRYNDVLYVMNTYYKDNRDITDLIIKQDFQQFVEYCKNQVKHLQEQLSQTESKRLKLMELNTMTLKFIPPLALLLSLIVKETDKQEQAKILYKYIVDFLREVNPNLLNYISNNIRNNLFNNKMILDMLKEMLSIDEYADLIHIVNDIVLSAFTAKRWINDKYIGLQAISAVINRSLSLLILRKVKHDVRANDKIYSVSNVRSFFVANTLKNILNQDYKQVKVDNILQPISSDNFVFKYFVIPVMSLKYWSAKYLLLLDEKTRTWITYSLINQITRQDIRKALTNLASRNLSVTFTKVVPQARDVHTVYISLKNMSNGYIQYEVNYLDKKYTYGIQKLSKFLTQHGNHTLKEYISQSDFIGNYILLIYSMFDAITKSIMPEVSDAVVNYILRVYQNIVKQTVNNVVDVKY